MNNDEIINKKRTVCQIHKSIEGFCEDVAAEMLNEARSEGYKEGHNDHKSDCLEYKKARSDTAKQILDDAKHFVFKIDYDYDISEEEQMQINFHMAEVLEQYSAFLENLKKKYKVD